MRPSVDLPAPEGPSMAIIRGWDKMDFCALFFVFALRSEISNLKSEISDKRREHFIRHQRARASQPDQVAAELDQPSIPKASQISGVRLANVRSEEFAITLDAESIHHS